MEDNKLYEFLRYLSPTSILIVNYQNRLKELHCPFKVKALKDVGSLNKGLYYDVTSIKITRNITTVYVINNQAYFYHSFEIV